jgi:peptide-methionine (S)-S-oxide reductase
MIRCIVVFCMLASLAMSAEEKVTKTATLGGGCFWCVEAMYQTVPGVEKVVSGYAGGNVPNPTYEQISTGRTGHAEVVQITYDPAKVGYEKIIDLFWEAHDPTTRNRQGADEGPQYRSIILYSTDEEKSLAEKSQAAAQADFKVPIVTEIVPLKEFYPAEAYHQDFYDRNPNHPYNRGVTTPKLQKFLKAQ